MRAKKILFLLSFLIAGLATSNAAVVAANNPSPVLLPSGGDVIAAINQYRQQNGIPPLTTIGLLNSLAQSQADYQASIGTITHNGPGGTTPQDRAASAGYGGGSFFYFSEIIYGGYNATTGDALAWWKNSGLHNGIMLDAKYTEIGAGVATDGTTVYFTAELGGLTGESSSSGSSGTGSGSGSNESQPPTQQAVAAIPVTKATPAADGSIIHIVQPGQSLWTIAAVYEIELNKLLEMNGLNNYSYVFPGDELIIQPALEPGVLTATAAANPSPSRTPTPGGQAKAQQQVIGTPFSVVLATTEPTDPVLPTDSPATAIADAAAGGSSGLLGDNPMVTTLVIAALVVLVLVIITTSFMQQKPNRPEKDDLLE